MTGVDVDRAEYEAYYDRIEQYDAREHIVAQTISTDDYPRFRCAVCGGAITIDPDGTEYGHYRAAERRLGGRMCPHRDEDAVGASGHPEQGRPSGAVAKGAD